MKMKFSHSTFYFHDKEKVQWIVMFYHQPGKSQISYQISKGGSLMESGTYKYKSSGTKTNALELIRDFKKGTK